MDISPEKYSAIEHFATQAFFGAKGVLALDLDGTALLEDRGRFVIDGAVERGVREIIKLGRPIVINSLRFPLSVIWSLGQEWGRIISDPIPMVLLNGSLLGYLRKGKEAADPMEYEEIASFPLTTTEIDQMVEGIAELIENQVRDIILFYYSNDWRAGETLWTPDSSRVEDLKKKYPSAAGKVVSFSANLLKAHLEEARICMATLLIDRPQDTLMAYQHSRRHNFFTHKGVDKAFGMRELSKRLGFSEADSFGAGDTEMDNFLAELGLAVLVGESAELPYRGRISTVQVKNPFELGELIVLVANLIRQNQKRVINSEK